MIQLPAGLTQRAITPNDIDAVTALVIAAELHDDGAAEFDRDDLGSTFARVGFEPALDSLVVFDADRPVAWAEIYRRRAEGTVLPTYRGRGIGLALLAWTEARALAQGAPDVGQSKTDADTAARELFLANGYEPTYTSWMIRKRLDDRPATPTAPAGITIRPLELAGDARAVHRVMDAAFSEWPGRDPVPFDIWEAEVIAHPAFAEGLSRVALDGDELVGVVLAYDYPEVGEGWVQQLATKASHRRRGIAQALLETVFAGFHALGRRRAGVSTDSRTGALTLYERVGMRVERSYTRYTKRLT